MIASGTFRRCILALSIFLGMLTQIQTVFACQLMVGEPQSICCCDRQDDMSIGCPEGGGCQIQDNLVSSPADCCDVSLQQTPSVISLAPPSHTQQLVLLDAPQLPPMPTSFTVADFSRYRHGVHFLKRLSYPHVVGTDTYLLTHRFRI